MSDQRFVRAIFQRGSGDADLEGIAVKARGFGAFRAGLRMDRDHQRAVGRPAMPRQGGYWLGAVAELRGGRRPISAQFWVLMAVWMMLR